MRDPGDAKVRRFRMMLNLEHADRLSMGDMVTVEYRPDVYHLGEGEPLPQKGHVGRTRDGRRMRLSANGQTTNTRSPVSPSQVSCTTNSVFSCS